MKLYLLRLCIAASFAIATTSASAQKFESAIDLNDYFVSITDTLYSAGGEWGTQLKKAMETKDYSSVVAARKKMELFLNRKLEELKIMKDQYGSENLRLTTMDFLAFERKMISEGFIPIEKFNKNSTDEEIKNALNNLSAAAKKESAEIGRVNKAQEEFAAKNGFTIAPAN